MHPGEADTTQKNKYCNKKFDGISYSAFIFVYKNTRTIVELCDHDKNHNRLEYRKSNDNDYLFTNNQIIQNAHLVSRYEMPTNEYFNHGTQINPQGVFGLVSFSLKIVNLKKLGASIYLRNPHASLR